MSQKILAVIPARYGSTRFPGKPLALIKNKPMIQWVIEGVKASNLIDEVIVATDHQQIYSLSKSFGARPVMTQSDLASGTDRVYAAINSFAHDQDLIINIQGDEPLIQAQVIDLLIMQMKTRPSVQMGTLVTEFENEEDIKNINCVKVILNDRSEAIYFSRFPIPYSRTFSSGLKGFICKRHVGIYGYRFSFLKKFCQASPVPLELAESLEQLRALQMGCAILAIETSFNGHGVDSPADITFIEQRLN